MERIFPSVSPFHETANLRPEAEPEIGFDLRASELRMDPERQRMRSGSSNIDPFEMSDIKRKYAPTDGRGTPEQVAREIDFNWKRYETYGKADFAEQRGYFDQGWRPVMHSMFPGRFAPAGADGPIIVKDMILMERPMRLTVEARNDEIRLATHALRANRDRLAATPDGQAPRIVITDRTTREAIEIPE